MIQLHPLRVPPNDIPDNILGYPFAPWRALTVRKTRPAVTKAEDTQ
jgi:hypothetical protein